MDFDIYIHKDTGKGWILIRENDFKNGTFISPNEKILIRPFSEFKDLSNKDTDNFLKDRTINNRQIEKYKQYWRNRKEEKVEKYITKVKELIIEYGKQDSIRYLNWEESYIDFIIDTETHELVSGIMLEIDGQES